MTHKHRENQSIDIYPEIIAIMKLAKRDIKWAIISMFHRFKIVQEKISVMSREMTGPKDKFKILEKIPKMKNTLDGINNILGTASEKNQWTWNHIEEFSRINYREKRLKQLYRGSVTYGTRPAI